MTEPAKPSPVIQFADRLWEALGAAGFDRGGFIALGGGISDKIAWRRLAAGARDPFLRICDDMVAWLESESAAGRAEIEEVLARASEAQAAAAAERAERAERKIHAAPVAAPTTSTTRATPAPEHGPSNGTPPPAPEPEPSTSSTPAPDGSTPSA